MIRYQLYFSVSLGQTNCQFFLVEIEILTISCLRLTGVNKILRIHIGLYTYRINSNLVSPFNFLHNFSRCVIIIDHGYR